MPLTEKDRQLITQLLTGSTTAWNSLVDRYAGLIVQVIRHTAHAHSLKLSQDDIEDLAADVFSTLLERDMAAIRGFRGRSSFSTYLTVIVRRVVLRKLTQRRYARALGHVRVHKSSISEATEGTAARQVDNRDEVDSLMTRLPEPARSVVQLFYLDGRTYNEISRRLGIPVNSIGPAISRAREMLRGTRRAT